MMIDEGGDDDAEDADEPMLLGITMITMLMMITALNPPNSPTPKYPIKPKPKTQTCDTWGHCRVLAVERVLRWLARVGVSCSGPAYPPLLLEAPGSSGSLDPRRKVPFLGLAGPFSEQTPRELLSAPSG